MNTLHIMENHAVLIFYLLVIFIYTLVHLAEGYHFSDVDRLMKDKLSKYNKKLRPVLNQSDTLNIEVSFDLVSFEDFDAVLEKFSAFGILSMSWIDEHMTWDPKDYNGVDSLVTENGDFWTPQLFLLNTFTQIERLGQDWYTIRYYPNGRAFIAPCSIFTSRCTADVTYYPWDTQECSFIFTPWGFLPWELTFNPKSDKISTTYFYGNGAWDLGNTSAIVSVGGSFVEYRVTIKRKSRFIIFNVMLPIVFLSFLNIVVFMIPTESGERVSHCLTVLLAITVFLTLVGDNLPKTSTPMSIFSYYLVSILITSICITVATIVSIRIYYRDEDTPVPSCLVSLVVFLRCGCKMRRRRKCTCSRRDSDSSLHSSGDVLKARNNNLPDGQTITNEHNNARLSKYLSTGQVYSNEIAIEEQNHNADSTVNDNQRSGDYSCYKHKGDNVDIKRQKGNFVEPEDWRIHVNESLYENKVSWKEVSVTIDTLFFIVFTILLMIDSAVFWLVMTQQIQL